MDAKYSEHDTHTISVSLGDNSEIESGAGEGGGTRLGGERKELLKTLLKSLERNDYCLISIYTVIALWVCVYMYI